MINYYMKIIRKIIRELTLKWRKPERYFIERKILPQIKNKKVLIVGVARYTANYPIKLKTNEVITIDLDPKVAKYGAQKHIISSITNAEKYFSAKYFDVILMLGVFGYGLNERKNGEKAMKVCYNLLKNNGKLFLQWNTIPSHNQINPKLLKNYKSFISKEIYKTKKSIFELLVKK